MPPFSPAAYGALPNSRKLFCPENPCRPSVSTHGGSMRPVERFDDALLDGPFAIEKPLQSALSQYTAPGTRRSSGSGTVSIVLARCFEITAAGLHLGKSTPVPHDFEPSAGPP